MRPCSDIARRRLDQSIEREVKQTDLVLALRTVRISEQIILRQGAILLSSLDPFAKQLYCMFFAQRLRSSSSSRLDAAIKCASCDLDRGEFVL
jgi:hypothetical protein